MATANSVSAKYLRMGDQDYIRVMLGIDLFLLLSLIRGFIPVTIGYILNLPGVTNEMAALFFILPMISLYALPYTKDQYRIMSQLSVVVWILAVLITNLLIKFILILVGLYLVFSVLLLLLTIELSKMNITESIFIMILFDFGLKSVSRGNDPMSYYNYISIIFILPLVILGLLFIRTNIEVFDVTPLEPISEESNLDRVQNSSIIGFFLGLLIYFVYFSNPGIMVLSLGLSDQSSITLFIVVVTFVSFIGYIYYPKFMDEPRLFYLTPIILLFSVFLVPWIRFSAVFSVLGLFSLVVMISHNISNMPKHLSPQTSTLYFISLLSFLVFLFLIISEDGTNIPIIFTTGFGVFTTVSYYYSRAWRENK